MTTVPEVVLAKEAGICYASIAMATDYDCWKEHEEVVRRILFSTCMTWVSRHHGSVLTISSIVLGLESAFLPGFKVSFPYVVRYFLYTSPWKI